MALGGKTNKKNYWQGTVGDAKYYLDVMTKENGTIYNNPEAYKKLTPFNRNEEKAGNENTCERSGAIIL